jgi:hypothetical protein
MKVQDCCRPISNILVNFTSTITQLVEKGLTNNNHMLNFRLTYALKF